MGVINVEAVAALKPGLLIAEWGPLEKAYSGLEEGTSAASKQIKDIAPIVGVAQVPSIQKMIERGLVSGRPGRSSKPPQPTRCDLARLLVRNHADYAMSLERLTKAIEAADEGLVRPVLSPLPG